MVIGYRVPQGVNMLKTLLILLPLSILLVNCSGSGRQRFPRDHYCFDPNPEKGELYDPIPVNINPETNQQYLATKIDSTLAISIEKYINQDIEEIKSIWNSINLSVNEGLTLAEALEKEKDAIDLLSPEQKTIFETQKKEAESALADGDYEYAGGEIYISRWLENRANTRNPYQRFHIKHVKTMVNEKPEFNFSTNCLSNMPDGDVTPVNIETVTHFSVAKEKIFTLAIDQFSVGLERQKIFNKIEKNIVANPKSPKEVVSEKDAHQFYKVKGDENVDFELRQSFKSGGFDVYVATRFKKKIENKTAETR